MIKKYIKKPIEIEAIQLTENNIIEVFNFIDGENYEKTKSTEELEDIVLAITKQGYIQLEGIMIAGFGDYIIKNQGKYYPCRPNTFQATYEEVR